MGSGTRTRITAPLRTAAACALLALLSGCESTGWFSAPPSSPALQREEPMVTDLRGYRIEVRSGQTFEVRLPGNASTGYRWTLVDPVPAIARSLGLGRYEPGRTDLAGAPGTEAWTFEAVGRGTAPLNFEYRRPWEPPTVPPAQRATYRLEVR